MSSRALLLDENLSPALVRRLEHDFPGIAHVTQFNRQGMPDIEIWRLPQSTSTASCRPTATSTNWLSSMARHRKWCGCASAQQPRNRFSNASGDTRQTLTPSWPRTKRQSWSFLHDAGLALSARARFLRKACVPQKRLLRNPFGRMRPLCWRSAPRFCSSATPNVSSALQQLVQLGHCLVTNLGGKEVRWNHVKKQRLLEAVLIAVG